MMNRIDESLAFYKQNIHLFSNNNNNDVNIDYLKCYLLLFDQEDDEKENTAKIENILNKYLSKKSIHPTPKQKINDFNKIKELLFNINDIDTKTKKQQNKKGLEFIVDETNKKLMINSYLITKCDVNFYEMNIELLFSKNPFSFCVGDIINDNKDNNIDYILPNVVLKDIDLKGNSGEYSVDIPSKLLNKNLLIRINSADLNENITKNMVYSLLNVQIKERYGQIKVFNKINNKPIKKAYVKVMCEMINGKTEFYKDGYTDFGGKFDYVSISNQNQLKNTTKFAILIVTQKYGIAIKYSKPPKQ